MSLTAAPVTIDEVIRELTWIVDWAKAENSRLGYFPALYRNVTIRVKEGIANGLFEDGRRMERLDVVFASRYLDAFRDWRGGKPVSQSWKLAFEAASYWFPAILHHLLMGINAHINLDLGIATGQVAPGPQLLAIRNDFFKISELLSQMTLGVKHAMGQVSPWIGLVDRIGVKSPEVVANFNIKIARDLAWLAVEQFAALPADGYPAATAELDTKTALFGEFLLRPGLLARTGLLAIRVRETAAPSAVIGVLSQRV